jgi:hypothetical protein
LCFAAVRAVSPTCPLERLILRSADVDDFECERFVEAIKNNNSLVELDLSNNKIGSAENLNTVMPDLITGGEALAELLRLPQCKLRTLKVDWNMIRLDGAIDFADSLRTNSTLTYLDLSFNSLGTDGGITMGVSILSNTTLETLILQSNNLDSVACFTICAGVIENRGLKKVVLDGNPIGEQVRSAATCSHCVIADADRHSVATSFSLFLCMLYADCIFYGVCSAGHEGADVDPDDRWEPREGNGRALQHQYPRQSLLVQLREAHRGLRPEHGRRLPQSHRHRPVAPDRRPPHVSSCRSLVCVLFSPVIAHWCNVLRFVFTKFIHETTKGGKVNQRKVDLVQKPSTEASQHFDRRQRFVLDGLLKMKAAASDIQTAIRLFQEVDADNSGEWAPGCFCWYPTSCLDLVCRRVVQQSTGGG